MSSTTTATPSSSFFDKHIMVGSGMALQVLALVFYACVLHVVKQMKKNDSKIAPFYSIFFWIGVVDCIHCVALIWMNFESAFLVGPKLMPITHLARTLTCFCYLVNIIGNGIMAVNRYSATFSGHMKHFSKFLVSVYLIGTALVSFVLSIPAALSMRHYYRVGDDTWTIVVEPMELVKVQRVIIVSLMITYTIVGLVFTLLAYNRIATFIHSPKYHQSDRTLLVFVMAHMAIHFWMLVFEIAEIFEIDFVVINFLKQHYFIVFYISTVSNGFFIVLTTARARKALFKCVCSSIKVSPVPKTSGSTPNTITVTTRF